MACYTCIENSACLHKHICNLLSPYALTSTVMSQLSFGITDIPRSSQKGWSRLVSLLISNMHCITLNTHWSSSEQQLQWFSQAPMVLVFEFSSTIHLSLQGFGRHGARGSKPADISVCCIHLPFLSPCFLPLARNVPSRLRKRLTFCSSLLLRNSSM